MTSDSKAVCGGDAFEALAREAEMIGAGRPPEAVLMAARGIWHLARPDGTSPLGQHGLTEGDCLHFARHALDAALASTAGAGAGDWQPINLLAPQANAMLGRWCRCGDREDGSEHWYWQQAFGRYFDFQGERHWCLDGHQFEAGPFYGETPTHFYAVASAPSRQSPAVPASPRSETVWDYTHALQSVIWRICNGHPITDDLIKQAPHAAGMAAKFMAASPSAPAEHGVDLMAVLGSLHASAHADMETPVEHIDRWANTLRVALSPHQGPDTGGQGAGRESEGRITPILEAEIDGRERIIVSLRNENKVLRKDRAILLGKIERLEIEAGEVERLEHNLDVATQERDAAFDARDRAFAERASASGFDPSHMAEGCCSAVSPCSHQQRDPYSLCEICLEANRLAQAIEAHRAETQSGSLGDESAVTGAAGQAPLERVRHVKRGTEYEVLGEAEVQIATRCTCPDGPGNGVLPNSAIIREARPGYYAGDLLTVYRCVETGKLWCRFTDEFRDGRFVPAAPDQSPSTSDREG